MPGDRDGALVHGPEGDADDAVPVRGAWSAAAHPIGQRTGVHRPVDSALAGSGDGRVAVDGTKRLLGMITRFALQK